MFDAHRHFLLLFTSSSIVVFNGPCCSCVCSLYNLTACFEFNLFHYRDSKSRSINIMCVCVCVLFETRSKDDEKCRNSNGMCINRLYRNCKRLCALTCLILFAIRKFVPLLFLFFWWLLVKLPKWATTEMKKSIQIYTDKQTYTQIKLNLKSTMYQFWAIVNPHKSFAREREKKNYK